MKLHLNQSARVVAIALICAGAPVWSAEQATGNDNAAGNAPQMATDQAADSSQAANADASEGSVARASFASAIENREPIDKLTEANASKVYYFTELRDMAGKEVIHRWEHNGKVMAEVPFKVGGDRWRVYSSKRMIPGWEGEWKASVVDADGSVLSINTIQLNDVPAAEAAQDTANETAPAEEDAAPGLIDTPAEGAAQQQ